MNNIMRGLVAEVLVAEALGGQLTSPWDPWDIELESGELVEVKATGLYQAWPQERVSTASWSFSGATAWTEDSGEYALDASKRRRSTFYVFCLHRGVNPGDASEWDFRPVDTQVIDEEFGSQASVSAAVLDRKLEPPVLGFESLTEWVSNRAKL